MKIENSNTKYIFILVLVFEILLLKIKKRNKGDAIQSPLFNCIWEAASSSLLELQDFRCLGWYAWNKVELMEILTVWSACVVLVGPLKS